MLSGGVQEALFLLPTHFPTFLKSLKPKLGPTKPGNHFFNQNYSLYNLMGVDRGCGGVVHWWLSGKESASWCRRHGFSP